MTPGSSTKLFSKSFGFIRLKGPLGIKEFFFFLEWATGPNFLFWGISNLFLLDLLSELKPLNIFELGRIFFCTEKICWTSWVILEAESVPKT